MIGGNLEATIQVKHTFDNDLGEHINTWDNLITIKGWLDLSSGNSTHSHKTKTEENSYMLLTDYDKTVRDLSTSQCRCLINNRVYEVQSIDDPMELHDHLEISLKLLGVSNVNESYVDDLLHGEY